MLLRCLRSGRPILFLLPLILPCDAEAIPRETIESLKRATVFVEVKDSRFQGTGSGFILGRLKDRGYVVTNSHVVSENGSVASQITIVVNSGGKGETEVRATVVGNDEHRDLAILQFQMANVPPPIPSSKTIDLYETLPVYILGFPLGEALAARRGNPEITIARGSVSSVRKNDFDRVVAVQIDGSINPGNSGGPIVTDDGELVGVAVAKVRGTQIGLAIPARDLREMLLGRIKSNSLTPVQGKTGAFDVSGHVIDPLGRLKTVYFYVIERSRVQSEIEPTDDGRWSLLSTNMRRFPLKLEKSEFHGEVRLDDDETYLFQMAYTRGDGKRIYTEPAEFTAARGLSVAARNGQKSRGHGVIISGTPPVDRSDPRRPSLPFPKPSKTNARLTGAKYQFGEFDTVDLRLNTTPAEDHGRSYSPMAWSNDGEWLYLVDGDGVLRKLHSDGLTEEANLATGAACTDLSISKAGIVLALQSAQCLWVVNPDTLEVEREVHVPGVRLVAASSVITTAYAASGNTLYVVDLIKGGIAQAISRSGPAGSPRPAAVQEAFRNYILSLRASPDGKYLFMATRAIHRFRISRTNLIYEESSPSLYNGHTKQLCLSGDGKWIALPTGGGNGGVGYGIAIFDTAHLSRHAVALKTGAYPCAVGYDSKTGNMYAPSFEELHVFSPRGGKLKSIPIVRGSDVRRILVHPGGERFIVWSKSKIALVDTRPGRLDESVDLSGEVVVTQRDRSADGKVVQSEPAPAADSSAELPRLPFPKPERTGRKSTGGRYQIGEYDAVDLEVDPSYSPESTANPSPMEWSQDGRWLYLLDGAGTLRKLNADGLAEEASLPTGAACTDFCISKAGIVLALRSTPCLWVIDPDTLAVEREISIANVGRVSSSPSTAVAFASSGDALSIIDLTAGRVVQTIEITHPAKSQLPANVRHAFVDRIKSLRVSPDGRYLFTATIRAHKFRISNTKLIYEESSPLLSNFLRSNQLCISGDGKWLALPIGREISIFGSSHLTKHFVALETYSRPCAVGFDLKTSKIYVPTDGELKVFGIRGGKLQSISWKRADIYQTLMHPEGGRFVVWSKNKITLVDLKPGRLAEMVPDAIENAPEDREPKSKGLFGRGGLGF